MSSHKERGPSNRFYDPKLKPGPKYPVRPLHEATFRTARTASSSSAENSSANAAATGSELKSSVAKTVLSVPVQQIKPEPYSPDSLHDPTPPGSAWDPSTGSTVLSLPDRRDGPMLESPFRERKIPTRTWESTLPPSRALDSLFCSPGPPSPAWKQMMADAERKPKQSLLSDSSNLMIDAEKFGLNLAEVLELRSKAWNAQPNAYCPYSNFHVGATLLTPNGKVFAGVNIENSSYPVGICAEVCAFSKAVSEGERKFKALAVATDITPPASPCGNCRQFIREFCAPEMPVFIFDKDGQHMVRTVGQLLPDSFGPDQLKQGQKSDAALGK